VILRYLAKSSLQEREAIDSESAANLRWEFQRQATNAQRLDNHPPVACLGRARVSNRRVVFSLLTLLFSGGITFKTPQCRESFGGFQFSRCFSNSSRARKLAPT
jgi:hypothetical protein